MQIICTQHTVFELRMKKKKGRRTKLKFSHLIFLTEKDYWNSGSIFCIRIPKGLICKSFGSVCYGYLKTAPIPYEEDAILNLPNPYLRSSTVLFDTD